MSGHSKWSTIKHKKAAADSAKGKIFTKYANLITLAARDGGADPYMNPGLALIIEKAKLVNMPNQNIERAIKRGTGEDKEGVQFFEVQYEGYGPEGVAILVQTLTDNKNRTVASVRTAFTKNGGSMGETGCVSWMFAKKGQISITVPADRREEYELLAIDAGAEDVEESVDGLEIETTPQDFFAIKKKLADAGAKIEDAEIALVPQNTVRIESEETARKLLGLIDVLEEDEDVSSVAANFDISEELLGKIGG